MILTGMPRGLSFDFYYSLHTAGSASFQANPTIVTGDVKISKDGGLEANIDANVGEALPTVSPSGGKQIKVTLTASQMDAVVVMVRFEDAAGAEWDESAVWLYTSPIPAGTVDDSVVTPTQTTFGSSLTGYSDDELIDAYVLFLTGNNAGVSEPVTDYASSNGQLTFATNAWDNTPADGDKFIIVGSKK